MQISGGGDDAVKFGSDWSVGKRLDSYNVTVVNSVVGCGCNGLQFGSETLGDFHDYHFGKPAPSFRPLPAGSTADRLAVLCPENITITAAAKAGIGIVSMDGGSIHDISYRNITMQHTTTPVRISFVTRDSKFCAQKAHFDRTLCTGRSTSTSAGVCGARSSRGRRATTAWWGAFTISQSRMYT